MPASFFRNRLFGALLSVLAATAAEGHVVPNMTLEADFSGEGAYTLRINVDPRTFLATDPTSLPPVPASWYREQTSEQLSATQMKAREYLSRALGLRFSGQKVALPACEVQAIDGADNTPLKPETQEVHLLAVAHGRLHQGATDFQLDFAKDANTTLILIASQTGQASPRPQVIFPGETSRPFVFLSAPQPSSPPKVESRRSQLTVIVSLIAATAVFIGWILLNKYRHFHRGHRRPSDPPV